MRPASAGSSLLTIPRVPLKAMTFDGKAVYLPRRRRTTPTGNVSFILAELMSKPGLDTTSV
jgi:hypothetical protein